MPDMDAVKLSQGNRAHCLTAKSSDLLYSSMLMKNLHISIAIPIEEIIQINCALLHKQHPVREIPVLLRSNRYTARNFPSMVHRRIRSPAHPEEGTVP